MSKVAFGWEIIGRRPIMAALSNASAVDRAVFGLEHLHLESKARTKSRQGRSESRCHRSGTIQRNKGNVEILSGPQSLGAGTERHGTEPTQTSSVRSFESHAHDENAYDLDAAAPVGSFTPDRCRPGSSNRPANSRAKLDKPTVLTASTDHPLSIARIPRRHFPGPKYSSQPLEVPITIPSAPVASDRTLIPKKGRAASTSDEHHLSSKSVPRPSIGYLTQACTEPSSANAPQRLLLVLDLNGTLLFRARPKKGFHSRPWLPHFLDYCFANHSVLVWSSARPHNVTTICDGLFSAEQRALLLGEWARDKLNLTKAQYDQRLQVYKRLDSIWRDEEIQSRHPRNKQGYKWGQHNTVLIDDSAVKASAQPFNHLALPGYGKQQVVSEEKLESEGKGVLLQVINRIQELSWSNDVSYFLRSAMEAGR